MSSERKVAGRCAVKVAINEWELGVEDNPACEYFDRISRYVTKSLNRHTVYRHQKRMWCGDFVASCYDGMLAPALQNKLFQSTYRLWVLANYSIDWNKSTGAGVWKTNDVILPEAKGPVDMRSWHFHAGKLRYFQQPSRHKGRIEWAVEPGDIATVGVARSGSGRERPWGKHIVLCEGIEDGKLLTIEGNGHGTPPAGHGRRWEGVVRNKRDLSDVQMIIRLSDLDFNDEFRMAG